jgi:hypothetical protein
MPLKPAPTFSFMPYFCANALRLRCKLPFFDNHMTYTVKNISEDAPQTRCGVVALLP